MLKICFKIWAAANLMVLVVFAVPLLPHGAALCFLALLYSSLFSLPAIALLYALLAFLRFAEGSVWFSWTVLLLGTAVISFIAYSLFKLVIQDAADELAFILPLSFICGYSSVLLFSAQLTDWFEKFRYQRYENN
ncbi:MAG TPA: hypothetical protein VM871_08555 [Flavisolibacter sp.]|nr:hypothetical protein [Flavisolibacter sp.]